LDLEIYDPTVGEIDAAEALRRATLAERAALDFDPRIGLSEGATFARSEGVSALVLSNGFQATLRSSYASLSVAPVAEDEGGKKRRGHHWTGARHAVLLEDPESVGREAARRTLAKLGAKKIETTRAPVVFDPDVSRGLVGSFAGCILGGSIWRKASYLGEREGTRVASELVSIVDDPLIPRAPGSRPFDGEGLASRRTQVVEAGVLRTFLCDWYSARKLGRVSTASAGRSGGSIGSTTTNFVLQAGTTSPEAILASTLRGLYVTELLGFGFNPVTGDFSRGASGFWIENGERAFPVSEVTISSTLDAMLQGIDAVGTDLLLKTSTAAPTLRIADMTISGN
jgi:PmbA protein